MLVDQHKDRQFLILGSASRDLIQQSSETLAGRIRYLEVTPFSYHELQHHPKLGASWEGFALEEIIRVLHATPEECYFWGVHNQGELDLLIIKDGKKHGFEFKYSDAPRLTSSMSLAQEILNLDSFVVIYPGNKRYSLTKNIEVIGLQDYLQIAAEDK